MSSAEGVRIAMLAPCFWPEVRRGGERFVRDLASGLIARGHQPRLITAHRGRPTRSVDEGLPIARHWRPADSTLVRLGVQRYMTHLPFSYLSLVCGDDQIAHAMYGTDALVAARWTGRTGRPSIFFYQGVPNPAEFAGRRLGARVVERAVKGCTTVTIGSRTAAEACRRWLGVEPRVISPGVDLDAFTPGAGRAPTPTIWCGAAYEEPRKRVPMLIQAFPLVRRSRPNARLLLRRPHDPGVAAMLDEMPGVELREETADPRAISRIYREAWVSVLPSYGESFGLVLVEALACGTPVVGSRQDALPEIVNSDEIGRLFWPDDEEGLARALLEAFELAGDPSVSAACRSRAEDFSMDLCVDRHVALYRELLETHG
jgi:glycosyltransferase involved in cell wall biosynthesis